MAQEDADDGQAGAALRDFVEVPNRRLACLGVARPVADEQPIKLLARDVEPQGTTLRCTLKWRMKKRMMLHPPVAVHRRDSHGEPLVLFVIARVSTPKMPGTLFSCIHFARDPVAA